MKRITEKTKFDKILEINPDAGMILFEYGMHCIGCGMAAMETLEQGCLAHGMKKKEIKELIEKLNVNKKEIMKFEKENKLKKEQAIKINQILKKNQDNSIKKLKQMIK